MDMHNKVSFPHELQFYLVTETKIGTSDTQDNDNLKRGGKRI